MRWNQVIPFVPIVIASRIRQDVSQYVVKESHLAPREWTLLGRASGDHPIHLDIGLKQESFQELERRLLEISTPSHPRYGQHISADDVNALVRPSENTLIAVEDWLRESGISTDELIYSPGRDWIRIPSLPASKAEHLLRASYSVYRRDGQDIVRTTQWSIPSHLHDMIDTVQPTTSFMRPRTTVTRLEPQESSNTSLPFSLNEVAENLPPGLDPLRGIDITNPPRNLTAAQACNPEAVTPLCLRILYGTLGYTTQAADKNQMALCNYLGEFNNRSDIRQYLEIYRPEAAAAADEFLSEEIEGGINQQSPATKSQLDGKYGMEGDLDAQVMLGIGYPTPLLTYTTGGEPAPSEADSSTSIAENEPFLTWLQYVLAQPSLPTVVSTSYAEPEYTVPPAYARRVCQGFAQLGARGVSVIFGSGDFGVGKPEQCHSKDGTPHFVPRFPDSCPYGTSVAATRGISPEVVAYNNRTTFSSGGGFSDYFPQPTYQQAAVASYLSRLGNQYQSLFNSSGRAYPDVAAMGYQIVTVWNGTAKTVDGTSASAPIFAAVVSLLNDALIAAGKPALGFLNPWLYSKGFRGFTDVTQGWTKGCNTSGFPALEGWDSASGFGTPWFPKLRELIGAAAIEGVEGVILKPWYIT